MEYIFLIGRVLFGGYFILMGIGHFRKTAMLTQYAASKKLPAPKLGVIVGGIMLLLGGLGILLGMYVQCAVALLVVFLLVAAFTIHNFWAVSDPQAKMGDYTHFFKNLALAGAALMMLALPLSSWSF